jgi:hypothetical protein
MMVQLEINEEQASELKILLQKQNTSDNLLAFLEMLEENFVSQEEDELEETYTFEKYDDKSQYNQTPLSLMIYSKFSLKRFKEEFKIDSRKANLFEQIEPVSVSDFLQEALKRAERMPLINEKVRSEVLVMPILQEVQTLCNYSFTIFSGIDITADEDKGLKGVCDFVLSAAEDALYLEMPLFALVEAKKQDIEGSVGQCAAQMLGCQVLNEKDENSLPAIYGCITTGETWQFIKLEDNILWIDNQKYTSKTELEKILAIFQYIAEKHQKMKSERV